VRQVTQQGRQRIETNLQEQGVPLQELYLLEDRSQLQHPIPLRGDLREHTFSPPLTRDLSSASEASLLHPSSHETLTGGS